MSLINQIYDFKLKRTEFKNQYYSLVFEII